MKKIIKIIITLTLINLLCMVNINFAEQLKRILCPYCGESSIDILDDEYGVCQCESCEELLIITEGKVLLSDGRKIQLKDLYDVEALIKAIENGEFDVHDDDNVNDDSGNNYREYLIDDDDGEESYYEENGDNYDENEDLSSSNPSYKSSLEGQKTYLYSKDFKNYEPESDEEFYAYLEKLNNKKKKKKATESNISSLSEASKKMMSKKRSSPSDISIATKSMPVKNKTIIPHVIKYYASVESELYVTEVVMNGEEFKLRDVIPIDGFRFLGWSPNKEGTKLFKENSPLTLYNFNSECMPSARVYDFYAIWEKVDEVNK